MKVLLLSAYAATSHVHWQRSLVTMFPQWNWQVLSLPPRHFSWRIRGNPLYWSVSQRGLLEQDYDLLVATSMVDLATLRGLVPALARLPTVLYFHENQFDYPQQAGQPSLLEARMVSLYAGLAADRLAFNSSYNKDSFLAGVDALLRKLPDRVPGGVVAALAHKARVLPVPIDIEALEPAAPNWPGTSGDYPRRPLRLLWSGRFEHDKGGEVLWHTLVALKRSGMDYELALVGQRFRSSPAVFTRIESEFAQRLVHVGFLPSQAEYRALLRGADVVLSTACHEFQGLAVLEAVACGCLPALPGRQVYPEIYPQHFCYSACPDDPAREALAAAGLVYRLAEALAAGTMQPPDVSAFSLARLQPLYAGLFASLIGGAG